MKKNEAAARRCGRLVFSEMWNTGGKRGEHGSRQNSAPILLGAFLSSLLLLWFLNIGNAKVGFCLFSTNPLRGGIMAYLCCILRIKWNIDVCQISGSVSKEMAKQGRIVTCYPQGTPHHAHLNISIRPNTEEGHFTREWFIDAWESGCPNSGPGNPFFSIPQCDQKK